MTRTAKSRGARFIISTDAHHPSHLRGMLYGVTTARRAWLTASDVLNTLPLEQFTATIKRP
jgi:DNA polymerase (family 10)